MWRADDKVGVSFHSSLSYLFTTLQWFLGLLHFPVFSLSLNRTDKTQNKYKCVRRAEGFILLKLIWNAQIGFFKSLQTSSCLNSAPTEMPTSDMKGLVGRTLDLPVCCQRPSPQGLVGYLKSTVPRTEEPDSGTY